MRIMYHQTDQTLFSYGLIRSYLGRCEFLRRLKLFPKKGSLSQLLFRYIESKNNKKKKLLLLLDDDGANSCIKNPNANDNKPFGLVSDNDYPNIKWEYQTRKCRIFYNKNNNYYNNTIYNKNNNNNQNSEKKRWQ